VKLAGVTVDGKALGSLAADMHSEGSTLLYTATVDLVGAKVDGSGQTQLTGDYETQAKLTFGLRYGHRG
jgi:translocation and assembly module TamB